MPVVIGDGRITNSCRFHRAEVHVLGVRVTCSTLRKLRGCARRDPAESAYAADAHETQKKRALERARFDRTRTRRATRRRL